MDQALAIAEAIAIATFISTVAQERWLSRFQGRTAYALSVALSLACGTIAVARVGGFAALEQAADPFTFGIYVAALTGTILVASKGAFHVFVKPIAK